MRAHATADGCLLRANWMHDPCARLGGHLSWARRKLLGAARSQARGSPGISLGWAPPGSVSHECWHSRGVIWVKHKYYNLYYTGTLLVLYWRFTGTSPLLHWYFTGSLLVLCWSYASPTLISHSSHTDVVLVVHCYYTDAALVPHY